MKNVFYEDDALTGSKGDHLCDLDSDYRWEKGDEVWVEAKGKRTKLRVTWVNVTVKDGVVTRELLGLKL